MSKVIVKVDGKDQEIEIADNFGEEALAELSNGEGDDDVVAEDIEGGAE